jgi:hypothetical protein
LTGTGAARTIEPMLVFCQCFVGVVFLAAAVGKLRDYRAFVRSLSAMRVPPRLAGPVIVAEVAVPVLLAVGGTGSRAGFVLAAVLLAGFTVAIRWAKPATCHCFGSVARLGRRHLVRNAVLAVAAIAGAVLVGTPATLPAVILGGPLGVLGAAIVIRLDDLAVLFRPAAGNGRAARPAGSRTRLSTSPPH